MVDPSKKETVRVAMFNGLGNPPKRVEYQCTFVGKHFAVLRLIGWNGQEKRKWQITHRHTGYKSGAEFPTKAKAIEYATRLERYGARVGLDWSVRSGAKIEKHPKVGAVRKYAKKLRTELLASV